VKHYTPTLPSPDITYVSNQAKGCPGDTCLRVLFINRSKPAVRSILNLEDLLELCRSWKHTNAASGQRFTAECAAYGTKGLTDNIAGAEPCMDSQDDVEDNASCPFPHHLFRQLPVPHFAAVRSADIFVGMNGAAIANMLFMRPGGIGRSGVAESPTPPSA